MIGCGAAAPAADALPKALEDPSPLVRVAAADAMCKIGRHEDASRLVLRQDGLAADALADDVVVDDHDSPGQRLVELAVVGIAGGNRRKGEAYKGTRFPEGS